MRNKRTNDNGKRVTSEKSSKKKQKQVPVVIIVRAEPQPGLNELLTELENLRTLLAPKDHSSKMSRINQLETFHREITNLKFLAPNDRRQLEIKTCYFLAQSSYELFKSLGVDWEEFILSNLDMLGHDFNETTLFNKANAALNVLTEKYSDEEIKAVLDNAKHSNSSCYARFTKMTVQIASDIRNYARPTTKDMLFLSRYRFINNQLTLRAVPVLDDVDDVALQNFMRIKGKN